MFWYGTKDGRWVSRKADGSEQTEIHSSYEFYPLGRWHELEERNDEVQDLGGCVFIDTKLREAVAKIGRKSFGELVDRQALKAVAALKQRAPNSSSRFLQCAGDALYDIRRYAHIVATYDVLGLGNIAINLGPERIVNADQESVQSNCDSWIRSQMGSAIVKVAQDYTHIREKYDDAARTCR
jgi:hypothetical protein